MTSDAAKAFVSFLRCEAKQAEDRARSLRSTAAIIEANNLEGEGKILGYSSFLKMHRINILLRNFLSHYHYFIHVAQKKKRKKRRRSCETDLEPKTHISGYTLFFEGMIIYLQ